MELTDEELKNAAEGDLLGLMCAVLAFREHVHPVKGMADALSSKEQKIDPGRINSVLRNETFLGARLMIKAERVLHVTWYTRWVEIQAEQAKTLGVEAPEERKVPPVRRRNKREVPL